jgi:hypothetical protein
LHRPNGWKLRPPDLSYNGYLRPDGRMALDAGTEERRHRLIREAYLGEMKVE